MRSAGEQAEPWLKAADELQASAWLVLQLLAAAWSSAALCFGSMCCALGGVCHASTKQLAHAIFGSDLAEGISTAILEVLQGQGSTAVISSASGSDASDAAGGWEDMRIGPGPTSCVAFMINGFGMLWRRLSKTLGDDVALGTVASAVLSTFQGPSAVRLQALVAASALHRYSVNADSRGSACIGGKSEGSASASASEDDTELGQRDELQGKMSVNRRRLRDATAVDRDSGEGLWLEWPLRPSTERALALLLPSAHDAALALQAFVAATSAPAVTAGKPLPLALDFGRMHDRTMLRAFVEQPLGMWELEYRHKRCEGGQGGRQGQQLRAPPPHLALPAYLALMGMPRVLSIHDLGLELASQGACQALAVLKQRGDQDVLATAAAQVASAGCCVLATVVDCGEEAGHGLYGDSVAGLLSLASPLLARGADALEGAQPGIGPRAQAPEGLLNKLAQCSILPTLERSMRLFAAATPTQFLSHSRLLDAVDGALVMSGCGCQIAAFTCTHQPCRNHPRQRGTIASVPTAGRWPVQRSLGVVLTAVKLGRCLRVQLMESTGGVNSCIAVAMSARVMQLLMNVFAPGGATPAGLTASCPHALANVVNLWPQVARLMAELWVEVMAALTPPRWRKKQEQELAANDHGMGLAPWEGMFNTLCAIVKVAQRCHAMAKSRGASSPGASSASRSASAGGGSRGSTSTCGGDAELADRLRVAVQVLQLPHVLQALVRFMESAPPPSRDQEDVVVNMEVGLVDIIVAHQIIVEGCEHPACTDWLRKQQPPDSSARAGSSSGGRGSNGSGRGKQLALLPSLVSALKRKQLRARALEQLSTMLHSLKGPADMAKFSKDIASFYQMPAMRTAVHLRLPPMELLTAPGARPRLCGNVMCCNLSGASEQDLNLRLCAGCRAVRYCSMRCQVQHWEAGHRQQCAGKAEERAGLELAGKSACRGPRRQQQQQQQ